MFPHVTPSKKIPRLLLAQSPKSLQGLKDIQAIWPDRGESQVYDLSYGGMVISVNSHLGRVNPETIYEFLLRIPTFEDPYPIRAKIARISLHSMGLIFDNNLVENRLALEQVLKDRIVVENLRPTLKETLPPAMQSADVWLHGPFDTNVILWKKSASEEIQRAMIEYDNVIWIYEDGELIIQRSFTAVDEAHGYFNTQNLFDTTRNKVSMGASWLDRAVRLMTAVNEKRQGELTALVKLLKSQKAR